MGTLEADKLKTLRIEEIISAYPFARMFFDNNGIDPDRECGRTLEDYFNALSEIEKEEMAVDPEHFIRQLTDYIEQMLSFLGGEDRSVKSLTILPGRYKTGEPETIQKPYHKQNEIYP